MKPLTLQRPFHRLAAVPQLFRSQFVKVWVVLFFAVDQPESRDWHLGLARLRDDAFSQADVIS